MNKTRSCLLIVSLFVVLILTSSSSARPDHSKIVCANCHRSLIEAEEDGGSACDSCHNIKDNIQRLEQTHSKICSKCHTPPESAEAYHLMHNAVLCEKCHGNSSLPARPSVGITNCAGCHGASVSFSGGGKIHEVHKAKLESACPKCHGVRPSSDPSMISSTAIRTHEPKKEILSTVYAKVIDYRKYTLYEIFKKLSYTF